MATAICKFIVTPHSTTYVWEYNLIKFAFLCLFSGSDRVYLLLQNILDGNTQGIWVRYLFSNVQQEYLQTSKVRDSSLLLPTPRYVFDNFGKFKKKRFRLITIQRKRFRCSPLVERDGFRDLPRLDNPCENRKLFGARLFSEDPACSFQTCFLH